MTNEPRTIHELDESGRPIMSSAYEEEPLEGDEAMQTLESESLKGKGGDSEPHINRILSKIRNTLWIGGGGAVGIIAVANPDESPAGKMAQTIGGVGIIAVLVGTGVGAILEGKRLWDNRGNRQHNSTYEGEQY